VIETKNVAGKVTIRRGELFVAGRRKPAFVEEAWREAVAVQTVVSETMAGMEMDARPLICFHRADLPWGKTSVAGVALVYPRGMVKTLRNGSRRVTASQVAEIAAAIERRLPPA
jgi:hypothetical protein